MWTKPYYENEVFLLGLTISSLCSGCVSTTYTKQVAVTKDANGRIIQTVETEGILQPNQQGWPVQFEYLKGIRPLESKAGAGGTR